MTQSMMTRSDDSVVAGRPPLAPSFAFPVIDRLLHVRPGAVVGLRHETKTIVSVEVKPPAGFRYRPGQYAMVRLETEEGPDMRPLSIASAPQDDTLEFATRLGPSAFKRALVTLQPGAALPVSRPMGSFHFERSRPAIMVTGGIGITPLRSMLRDAAATGHDQPIRLLYGNRSVDEIAYRDELEQLAASDSLLHITWALSRPAGFAPAVGDAHVGRIDDALLRRHLDELPDAVFYLTGPAAMVGEVRGVLRHLGVPHRRVRISAQTLPIDRKSRSH